VAAGIASIALACGQGGRGSAAAAGKIAMAKDTQIPGQHQLGEALPGAPPLPPELIQKLGAAWAKRSPDYRPRTRHLNADGSPKYINRLFLESSPYLRQHAHNPVNWYPWGEEAFETARKLGRPVLLSVGYSTCHWCHVMEEESFDDEEIARALNQSYVIIKVDREERPDIDAIYMSAVQALTGSGGWPMTVWLTPDKKPFYGGTYFPARDGDRGAPTGFLTLIKRLREVYDQQGDRVASAAAELTRSIQANLAPAAQGGLPGGDVLRQAAQFYRQRFDSVSGGLSRAPKFPSSLPLRFLLRYHRRSGDQELLNMATLTLEKMAAGGMYDQVGGGFHRYSTDDRWLVPHFEKMLYDNALLTVAYLEGYQATGRQDFARLVREILRYVERDMSAPEGGFYSATDADSLSDQGEAEEGWFFTWTPAEIEKVLGPERARIAKATFGVTEAGNFEGRNILYVPKPLEQVACELDLPPDRLTAELTAAKEQLYQARAQRPAPLRDEKILTAWNGLMISAYARAALVLGEPSYAERAQRAASFVLERLRRDGRLLRSYKQGTAHLDGYLDDYAFLIAGLLDLYEATGTPRWLEQAIALDQTLQQFYEDKEHGGFFMTSADHEELLAREKPSYDGAEPSGNSVELLNLLRLQELTTEDRYRQRAERGFKAFGGILTGQPAALSEMLLAVDFFLDTPREIVIVTPNSRAEAEPFLAKLRLRFLPNRVLVIAAQGKDLSAQARLVPLLESKVARDGKAVAYVCEKGICELPTADSEVFARQISKVKSPEKRPTQVKDPT
jgi:uncharacterized protein YyaL (SSP411 family)